MGNRSSLGYEFTSTPWPDIVMRLDEMAVLYESFRHMARVARSIAESECSDSLAGALWMHDLAVAATPVRAAPVDVIVVKAPGFLQAPRDGDVRIEYLTATGKNDVIDRPTSEAVPLFWRFAKEKFGVEQPWRETPEQVGIRNQYVMPFYLPRRTVATGFALDVASAAMGANLNTVLYLLNSGGWREQRVGALFSLARPEPIVTRALLKCLAGSLGDLTFPILSASAFLKAGSDSIPYLRAFQEATHATNRPEVRCSEMAAAALEKLGQESSFEQATDLSRRRFEEELELATAIRAAAGH